MEGLDDIGLTMVEAKAISAFEGKSSAGQTLGLSLRRPRRLRANRR